MGDNVARTMLFWLELLAADEAFATDVGGQEFVVVLLVVILPKLQSAKRLFLRIDVDKRCKDDGWVLLLLTPPARSWWLVACCWCCWWCCCCCWVNCWVWEPTIVACKTVLFFVCFLFFLLLLFVWDLSGLFFFALFWFNAEIWQWMITTYDEYKEQELMVVGWSELLGYYYKVTNSV